jgi:rSAM/selenodomain-associated transferase 1
MTDKRCVIFFVKHPEKGRVKSRLARHIGETVALRLYASMVLDTIDMLKRGRFPFRVCYAPPEARDQVTAWLGPDYFYMPQRGEDLGDRMEAAFADVFSGDVEKALLIGSDIPGLTAGIVEEAFASLVSNDAVIGPADDGGYYLIGFRKNKFLPGIFHDMVWSTSTVFCMTLDRLREASLSLHVLSEMTDIDTVDDLKKLRARVKGSPSELSRTRTFIDEHLKDITTKRHEGK